MSRRLVRGAVFGALTLGIAAPLQAQSPEWATRFTQTTSARDDATWVAIDEAGDIYVAGTNDDGWVVWKLAPDGGVVWSHTIRGVGGQYSPPVAILFDAGGNTYLTGANYSGSIPLVRISSDGAAVRVTRSEASAGSAVDACITPGGEVYVTGSAPGYQGYADGQTLMFAADGTQVWRRQWDGPAHRHDGTYEVALGPTGDVYVAGSAQITTNYSERIVVVQRYAPGGELIWERRIPSDGSQDFTVYYRLVMAVDGDGNAYVAALRSSGGIAAGIVVFKLSSAGDLLWLNPYSGPAPMSTTVLRMAFDPQREKLFVAGLHVIAGTDTDLVVLRYSLDGQRDWATVHDGGSHERDGLVDLHIHPSGDVIATGSAIAEGRWRVSARRFGQDGALVGEVIYDRGSASGNQLDVSALEDAGSVIAIGSASSGAEHYADIEIVRLSFDAAPVPLSLVGTTTASQEAFVAAAAAPSGATYVYGTTEDSFSASHAVLWRFRVTGEFDWMRPVSISMPGSQLSVDSDENAYLLQHALSKVYKFAPNGALLWTAHYSSPTTHANEGLGIHIDADGNVYTCGDVYVTLDDGSVDRHWLVVKRDPNGAQLWAWEGVAGGDERARMIAVDASGEVTTVGNELMIRHRVDGGLRWKRAILEVEPRSVLVSPDGTVFVFGESAGVEPAALGLACYSDAGVPLWSRSHQPDDGVRVDPIGMSFTPSGDLVLLGRAPGSQDGDLFLVSYARDGSQRWAVRRPNRDGRVASNHTLSIAADCAIYVSARTAARGGSTFYDREVLLLRFDDIGALRWSSWQAPPSEFSGQVSSAQVSADGGLLLAGLTTGFGTRDDIWVARYSPAPPACPTINPCPGDLNADCVVDFADLSRLLSSFGTVSAIGEAPANGDADFDADVDLTDLALTLSAFGTSCQ